MKSPVLSALYVTLEYIFLLFFIFLVFSTVFFFYLLFFFLLKIIFFAVNTWSSEPKEYEQRKVKPTQLKNGKAALLDKASVDICNEDRNHGDDQCATNLREFQEFPKKWRGARGDAFTAMCQLWGTMGWKCSFFIKTSQGLDQPLAGYVHRMEDCVKDVKVDAYREAWRLRVVGS
ncbi:unnamed protein product [Bemisia tabaci]|uniref:Uncharacterized protein n=1 Tax=Bemisia tabaci TaxID=7038 RepID=A0A9P0A2M3_BEMTA|nr:unnamed protein product [Bemisia tabaci]